MTAGVSRPAVLDGDAAAELGGPARALVVVDLEGVEPHGEGQRRHHRRLGLRARGAADDACVASSPSQIVELALGLAELGRRAPRPRITSIERWVIA